MKDIRRPLRISEGGTGQKTAPLGMNALTVKGADIASAASIDLGAATGSYVEITGTNAISALGTATAGIKRDVRFMGALTLTHNGTSLILPGARDIVTEAGDRATFISLGSGNWECQSYMKANGRVLGDVVVITDSSTGNTTADQMRGQTHRVTGAYTRTLPTAVVGMNALFRATTAAVFSLDCQGTDNFILDGATLTAGYKISSPGAIGNAVYVECTVANKWDVYANCTMIDGGA